MSSEAAFQHLIDGKIEAWNKYRANNKDAVFPTLKAPIFTVKCIEKAQLHGINFIDANLTKTTWKSTNFVGASFENVDFTDAEFGDCDFRCATFGGCTFESTKFLDCDMREIVAHHAFFTLCNFNATKLQEAMLSYCHFEDTIITSTWFDRADLFLCKFVGCTGKKASFVSSNLNVAEFSNSDLQAANLSSAILDNSKFTNVTFDAATKFALAKVKNCRMERYALACLDKDVGDLTVGQRMDMNIVNAVATLRELFGGFNGLAHKLGMVAFSAPYLWFVGRCWFASDSEIKADNGISIIKALATYIWNGGEAWRSGFHFNAVPFFLFCFTVLYNALRFSLLWETRTLETREIVTEVPVKCSLVGRLKWHYWGITYGLYINLLVVLGHSYYFLLRRFIPSEW